MTGLFAKDSVPEPGLRVNVVYELDEKEEVNQGTNLYSLRLLLAGLRGALSAAYVAQRRLRRPSLSLPLFLDLIGNL
jgi:hypothetical protein